MKYKVGDRVRIVSKWRKGCRQNDFGEMNKWLGKVMTIRSVDYPNLCYKMNEDEDERGGLGWVWFENSIEGLVCDEKKIVITSDGEKTLARFYDGKKVIKTATAKCSHDDKFSFETGAKIAFERLFDSEEPKYFNGKAVCVNKYVGFTIGKIYEFVDGRCFDDQKKERPTFLRCKGLAFFGSVFIPLVE